MNIRLIVSLIEQIRLKNITFINVSLAALSISFCVKALPISLCILFRNNIIQQVITNAISRKKVRKCDSSTSIRLTVFSFILIAAPLF
jgi:hypothetical protein